MMESIPEYDNWLSKGLAGILLRQTARFDAGARLCYNAGLFKKEPSANLLMEIALDLRSRKRIKLGYEWLQQEFVAAAKARGLSSVDTRSGLDTLDIAFKGELTRDSEDYILMVAETVFRKLTLQDYKVRAAGFSEENVIEESKTFSTLYTQELFSAPALVNPFEYTEGQVSAIYQYMEDSERIPMHIEFMDSILDGGYVPGEYFGYLAPSGGGKSTLALQIAGAQIQHNVGHLHVSVEQAVKGDIAIRVCVVASGIERRMFKHPKDLSQQTRDALEKAKVQWSKYFRILDLSKTVIPSVDALMDRIDIAQDSMGYPIQSVTFDWWGRFRDRLTRSQRAILSDAQVRVLQRDWMDEMRMKMAQRGITCHVFHQLSGDAASKGAKHVASSHDAQEDKNFNNLFDFCFVVGSMTDNYICKFRSDKARSVGKTERVLKLDGPFCRFREATGSEVPKEFGARVNHVETEDSYV